MRKTSFTVVLIALAVACLAGPAMAADYPAKPVKFIINFSAGGSTDMAARFMAMKVEKLINGKLVAINEPGAGGTLGVSSVARAKGNGYTIGTCNMPAVAIIPQIREVPYKPFEDLVQVCAVMPYEYAVLVKGDSPWQTWEDLVEYVKKNPGKLTYGSVGTGTTNHLVMARMGMDLGLDWKHVPFQGGVKETAALLGGHVDVINNTTASVVSSLKGGQIRALMVTSEDRFPVTPDVPTMKEKGFGYSQISYMSIVAPKDTPTEVLSMLEAAFKQAVQDPEVLAECAKLNVHPRFVPGKQYQELLQKLSQEWGALLPQLGVK